MTTKQRMKQNQAHLTELHIILFVAQQANITVQQSI